MEDKYIRRQVLPIDDAARKRVKDLVNAYSAQGEGHPYANYGDQITLQKYELCPIYTVDLRTQYDSRNVSNRQYPYKGGSIYTRRFFKTSDVNVWNYDLLSTNEFKQESESYEADAADPERFPALPVAEAEPGSAVYATETDRSRKPVRSTGIQPTKFTRTGTGNLFTVM